MRLTHEFTVPAGLVETGRLLTDAPTIGRCLPGMALTEVAGDRFSGTFRVHLGTVTVEYAGTGRFVSRGARTTVVRLEGEELHGDGSASATTTVQLTPDGPVTRVEVETDLELTGRPAQFSPAIVQDASDHLVAGLVVCLQDRLARASRPVAAAAIVQDGAAGRVPVLARRYGGLVAAGALGVLVGRRLGRTQQNR